MSNMAELLGKIHNTESLKKAVMAIWHHTKSTDESPDHDLCPSSSDSWCAFQRDLANGTSDYQHDHPIPEAVMDVIHQQLDSSSKVQHVPSITLNFL